MKKLNKLLLGGLIFTVGFIFMNNVKAKGIEYRYPVYENGTIISYDKENNLECTDCDRYIVSEDDGEEDPDILLTKEDNTDSFVLNKTKLSKASVLLSTKPLDLNYDGKSVDGKNPEDIESVKEIIYYNSRNLSDILKEEDSFEEKYGYANILYTSPDTARGNSVIIPKNVTLTAELITLWGNSVNNGTIKTSRLLADKISGSGNINLMYDIRGYWIVDNKLDFNEISGVKVNAITNGDLEGLSLAYLGNVDEITKEDAQKKVDELNKTKGSTIDGYTVELEKNQNQTKYIAVLRKTKVEIENNDSTNQENQDEIKKEKVKNPSTGDATDLTAIIIMVSGVLAVITFKKAKQK